MLYVGANDDSMWTLGICTEFWLHGVSCSQNWHGRAAVARNKENLKKASTSSVQQGKFCTKAPCTRFLLHGNLHEMHEHGFYKVNSARNSVQQCIFCTKAPCTRFFRVFFARTICTKCTKLSTCTKHELHGRAAKSPCKHPAFEANFYCLFLSVVYFNWCCFQNIGMFKNY